MLRVLFADQGGIGQLRQSIQAIATQAAARRAHFADMAAGILATGGQYPHRAHVNALGMQFMTAYFDQFTAWADWALEAIDGWDDTTTPAQTWAPQARDIFTRTAQHRAIETSGNDTAGNDP
jgi:PadR family transcriptional regulator, regulatory protein AphA